MNVRNNFAKFKPNNNKFNYDVQTTMTFLFDAKMTYLKQYILYIETSFQSDIFQPNFRINGDKFDSSKWCNLQ